VPLRITVGGEVTHNPSTGCAAHGTEVEHRVVEEKVQEGVLDQEEDEPLTRETPDDDEGNILDGDDPPPDGLPCQIPTEKEIPKD
jgi:hypothetical protein